MVTQKLHHSGHLCISTQVVILPSDWDGKVRFLDALERALSRSESRKAYYPGTEQRLQTLREADLRVQQLGGEEPRLMVREIDAAADHLAFREALFGPAIATTSLPGEPAEFLRAAVEFVNDRLKGTLGVNLIVDPRTAKRLRHELDQAVADMRYGGIGINIWVGAAFLLALAAWGAFPGHSYDDIESGIGVVHNALMFDNPQKTVVRAPFRPFPRSVLHGELAMLPKPPWFLTNRTSASTVKKLTEFAADPRPRRLLSLFASALRG
jgi:aldehyde dehydrogenase (NAD(P)+)